MEDQKKHLARLLKRAQHQDHAALEELCKALEQIVRGYFFKKFQDENIVKDLSQEAYFRFLNNFPQIREPMKLKSFIFSISLRVMQDYFRQFYHPEEIHLVEEMVTDPVSEASGSQIVPSSGSDFVIEKMDLEKALAKLSERTRTILQMKSDGFRYEEIAAELDISLSTVKMQVSRGMEKLKNFLTDVTFLLLFTTILMKGI
ncbi:hypothetical protein B1H10_01305 [candidate division KSB1 bacterium 4484_188]|nr:MAG: hypothetical protein B1H10_01305 [candidate division KSB1 bacterium 4484_188]